MIGTGLKRSGPAVDAQEPQELALRPLLLADLDQVLAIEVTAYPHPWSRGNFVDSLVAGYHARCLVDADGRLIAYMLAMASLDELHLLNITVAPDQQGRGHALRLLQALVEQVRLQPATCLWLEVRPSNLRARQLYERFGFEQVGVRRAYYPAAHGQREDALVLRLLISPTDGL
jgi:ribosomal-protein-alanine N-acetyltransferase